MECAAYRQQNLLPPVTGHRKSEIGLPTWSSSSDELLSVCVLMNFYPGIAAKELVSFYHSCRDTNLCIIGSWCNCLSTTTSKYYGINNTVFKKWILYHDNQNSRNDGGSNLHSSPSRGAIGTWYLLLEGLWFFFEDVATGHSLCIWSPPKQLWTDRTSWVMKPSKERRVSYWERYSYLDLVMIMFHFQYYQKEPEATPRSGSGNCMSQKAPV